MTGTDPVTQDPAQRESTPTDGAIGRQIKLPLSKALEISFNAVRIRKWRSLITASGIVLAITFLMATLASGKTVASIKSQLPREIAREQEQLAEASASLARGIDSLGNAEPGLKKVKEALGRAEYTLASERFTQALAERESQVVPAELQALQARMPGLMASATKLEALEKMRLAMLKRGANFSTAEEGSGQTAADKESTATEARETWLVVLALVVALVGIMNSMLMSVTERFREIGTMKCLGALDNFILKLFLIESSVQGFLGTAIGVVLGLALSGTKIWWDYGGSAWAFLPWNELGKWTVIAILIGTGLSFSGALVPAFIAAKMEPVVAMRQDQ